MLLVAVSQNLFSQTTITGVVSDEDGVPLPGATVLVEGTSNGTTTDFDGNYVLDNVNAADRLTFSYIGMSPQTVAVGTQATIDIGLAENAQALDEVVVVGYGQQSRADVTGAISTVDSDAITAIPVTNAEQALQGRAPGVSVTNSGSPGSSPVVRIRGLGTSGSNKPLFVIDGVITGGLSGINPNDIENVSVLKDASTTAIYGSQGSNGVIIVTTKKGNKQKGELSFNTYTGYQANTKRYDVLNTLQYLQYANDLGVIPARDADLFANNTNWQDEIFTSGVIQDHNLSYAGGSENSDYRFSAGYVSQDGVVINTGFERYSFRANSSFTFGKLKVGETMSVSFNKQNPLLENGGRSLIEHAIKAAPYLPVYNENNLGGFQGPTSSLDGQDAENPVRIQTLGNAVNNTTAIIGSIYGEYEIIEGLKFKSQVGLDYFTFNNNRFVPSYDDDSEGGATHSQPFAAITKNSGYGQTLIFTNSLNYTKTIDEVHNIEFLLLSEKYENSFNRTDASSRNLVSDEVNQLSNEQSALNSETFEDNRISYLARLNYNYDGRYILAASIRRDASSRFGENNKWANFPSVALGWNISKESFMEDTAFSNLKLRGSYGLVGNNNLGNYETAPTLNQGFLYPIGGVAAVGTTADGLPNPNLKWEETTMTNIGLDFGLFQETFTASIEYYNNSNDKLLISTRTPTSLGFNSGFVTRNVGRTETKGVEVNLGYNDYDGDFTWSANLNFSTTENSVKFIGSNDFLEGSAQFEGSALSRITVGEPLFGFFGLKSDGIYQTQAEVDAVLTANPDQTTVQPGDVRFIDINGDGQISSEDNTFIGNPYPDVTFGLNINGGYKNFDFNMFINGVVGNDIYNTNIFDLQGQTRLFNSGVAVLDRWTPTNPSNTVPRAQGAPQNTAISDYFVEDGSYGRLKNVTLGYTLPNDFLKDYFSKFRIYVSGQNLLTVTDYSGLDPEISNASDNQQTTNYEYGIDRGNYPQPVSVLLGLQVTF